MKTEPEQPDPSVARLYRRIGPDAEVCYTVESARALSDDDLARLAWLAAETFGPGESRPRSFLNGDVLEVGPRLSIETPFSSNAVAICHATGLTGISRIEQSRRAASGSALARRMRDGLDRMTEAVWDTAPARLLAPHAPEPVRTIPLLARGRAALEEANRAMGLGMDAWDLDFYHRLFAQDLGRDPTDVELFQLGQSNSEHSRHWYFKGVQVIDGAPQPETLFAVVQAPLRALAEPASLVAFRDNGGVIRGHAVEVLLPDAPDGPSRLRYARRTRHIVATAETHNHPTFVSPFPGAATGTGGMLRDLSAIGRGSLAGVSAAGYLVGNLFPPGTGSRARPSGPTGPPRCLAAAHFDRGQQRRLGLW